MKKGKKSTLADIVKFGFKPAKKSPHQEEPNINIAVKVPELPLKAPSNKPQKAMPGQKKAAFDIPSILSSILRNSNKEEIEKNKAKSDTKTEQEAKPIEENEESPGGYGTSRRGSYGVALSSGYANYEKLYSHMGSFKAKGAYDDLSPAQMANKALDESGKFFFLDREVIDTGMRQLKYNMAHKISGDISAVPMGGINSKDWEMFKLWSKIDPVMYQLKMNTM